MSFLDRRPPASPHSPSILRSSLPAKLSVAIRSRCIVILRSAPPNRLANSVHWFPIICSTSPNRTSRSPPANTRGRRGPPSRTSRDAADCQSSSAERVFTLRALLEGLFPGPQRSEELRERLRASGGPARFALSAPDAGAARSGSGCENPCQRFAEADSRHRGLSGFAGADERVMEAARARSSARLSGPADRTQPAAREALRAHQPACRADVRRRPGRRDKACCSNAIAGNKATPLESLGYKQAAQFLRGELTREQAVAAAQQGHRNYAKRQMTWFRREPDVRWLDGFGDDPAIARQAAEAGLQQDDTAASL